MQTLSPPLSETTRIEVNVSEFARGEIAVKLRRDNTLLVHALHLDQFAADNFFRKELVKTFPLPPGADVDKIRSIIRNTGILTIDIPMLRDKDATRRSHEELLRTIDEPYRSRKPEYNRSSSHADVRQGTDLNQSNGGRAISSVFPKRTGSLIDIDHRTTASNFNIAEFLQSKFRPTFSEDGKRIHLKIDTRGYEPDELSVRLVDETLIVQGKKKPSSTTKKHDDKQLNESIRLPDGIDKYNVTSQVTENGTLFIDIPLIGSSSYR